MVFQFAMVVKHGVARWRCLGFPKIGDDGLASRPASACCVRNGKFRERDVFAKGEERAMLLQIFERRLRA